LRAALGGTLEQVHALIEQIGQGDFLSASDVDRQDKNSVLAQLAWAQRNLAEQARQHQRNEADTRIAAICFESPDGIFITNADGVILRVNPAFTKITGYSAEEAVGQTPHLLNSGYHEKQFFAELWQTLSAEGIWTGEIMNRRKNGEIYAEWQNIKAVRGDHGQITHYVATMANITERKRAEAQMRELNLRLEQQVKERTAELESALEQLQRSHEELTRNAARATLSMLIASVTHELNTPIGNSVLAASTLSDTSKRFQAAVESGQLKRSELMTLLDNVREGTDLLQHNLQRAQALLQNFKQVAADQASEQRRQFDLATVIKEVVATLAPSLKTKPQRVVIDIPAGIVMTSLPGPLGQVAINLINNAYMHAFEGRENGVLTITAQQKGDEVTLRFADNGIGISPETQQRMLEPFFSTKIGRGGTGLGMSIVAALVTKSLGGSFSIQSAVGVGTTIEIHIPLEAPLIKP
jgi:PAS domain S-box-containing protein